MQMLLELRANLGVTWHRHLVVNTTCQEEQTQAVRQEDSRVTPIRRKKRARQDRQTLRATDIASAVDDW